MDHLDRPEEAFLDVQNTREVLPDLFETPLPDFPMLRPETEQDNALSDYAESISGRNVVQTEPSPQNQDDPDLRPCSG